MLVSLTLVTATVVVLAVALRPDPTPRTPPAAAPVAVIAPRAAPDLTVVRAVSSLAVLRDWDAARARAWRRGSVAGLQRLYLPGSRAGVRDASMLRRWIDRGLRVSGMRVQVLAVRLVRRTDRRLVLVTTDRLAGAVAVDRHGRRRETLPQDLPSERRLEFVRVGGPSGSGGRWVLAAVYERSSAASPAASTASMSGSANS